MWVKNGCQPQRNPGEWRHGRGEAKNLDTGPRFGTVAWLFERYRRSVAFARVGTRSRPEYLRALKRIEDLPTKTGGHVGDLLVSSISARAVDKIYDALQNGPRGKRVRQANLSIDIGRRAWKIVRRLHPSVVATENPFEGVLKIGGSKTKVAATRAEAYALAEALKGIGEPHLGAAALICFEWLQRPENVLTGKRTKRSDYSASAYTSRLRTSYSSSTRWNRTSRAILLRRSGRRAEARPGGCAIAAEGRGDRRLACRLSDSYSTKNGGYLGQCPCLPAGQLDPDERTEQDDAGAIQNLVCATEAWQRSWAVIAFPYMQYAQILDLPA